MKLYEASLKEGYSQAEPALLAAKSSLFKVYFFRNGSVSCFKFKPLTIELSEQNTDIETKALALRALGEFSSYGKCSRENDLAALEFYGQSCDLGNSEGCALYSLRKKMLQNKNR
ncbi:hypothetical protein RO21_11805 [[Actinobacillus] muris]|uniref:Sel1 repeat family protein n=1 Tax=Muribacter muris TaxID=67855 RepID=A0A0J5P4S0_9PAST|nr:hypothetical protein [Muribacter muris]KMK50439.1 hypothetical protein RO21_11805 [[Actinobacillus] muris] [Muribacter muris]